MELDPPAGADDTVEDGGTDAIDRDDQATVDVPDTADDDATPDPNADDSEVPE